MSATRNRSKPPPELETALEQAESAIGWLEHEGVFSIRRDSLHDDELDWDSIDYRATELETALEVVADELTMVALPDADEVLTIDELLARFVRQGLVDKSVVEIAATLIENLGTTSSAGQRGVCLNQGLDSSDLEKLIESLRALASYLYAQGTQDGRPS